jgi:cell division protein FtsN
MAARRNKTQARRNQGNGNPAWIWLVAGLVLGAVLVFGLPKLMPKGDGDGFFRPKPNPDAQPVANASADDDDAIVPEDVPAPKPKPDKPKYDFYTLLPANEVALSDAELAETERAESERQAKAQQAAERANDAAATQPTSTDAATQVAAGTTPAATPARPDTKPAQDDGAKYLLQAGAFQASGDAEAVKAKIALLGLTARVESAQIADKTVFRVRMGPYGSASELADAKRRLSGGGLPALAIKAR